MENDFTDVTPEYESYSDRQLGALQKQDEALCRVMKSINKIEKDAKNKFDNYTYASVDSIYEHVRPVLAKEGVTINYRLDDLQEIQHGGRGFMCLPVNLRFGHIEPYARHFVPMQTGGKAGPRLTPQSVQAAISYATKYFLKTRLLLATGDQDMDAVGTEGVAVKMPKPQVQPKQENNTSSSWPEQTSKPQVHVNPPLVTVNNDYRIEMGGKLLEGLGGITENMVKELYKFLLNSIKTGDKAEVVDMLKVNSSEMKRIPEAGQTELLKHLRIKGYPDSICEIFQPKESQ